MLDVAMTGLTKAMDGLKNTIESAFSFAMQAEKASLALGMSFETANNQLGGTMEGLRGDLNERFAGAIAGMEAGLQGNTAGIARLINQQRLTGTASAKTAAAFASMEQTMGLSREATNKLASDMVEMGAEFQISTDNLVGAINMMAESFPAQKLAGMGAEVNAAVAGLQAELGPAMSGPLNNVMKMVMDTSMEGYEKLTQLGIGGVREQLAAAKSQEEAQMILKNAIATASDNFKSVVGDASKGFFQVGVAADIFGKSAVDLTTIQDAFGQRVKVEKDQTEDFGNQLGVLKSEILVPLQAAFLEFFPVIKEVATILMEFAKGVISDLVDKGKAFLETFGSTDEAVAKLKEKFEEFRPKVVEVITSVVKIFSSMKVVLGALMIAAIIPLKIIIGSLITAFSVLLSPVGAVIAAVGAVVGIFVLLQKKFGLFDPILDAVSAGFKKVKEGLGSFLISLGEMVPDWLGGGLLREMGESLASSVEENQNILEEQREVRRATRAEAIEMQRNMIKREEARIEREKDPETRNRNELLSKEIIRDSQRSIELRKKLLEKLENQTDAEYEAEAQRKEDAKKQEGKLGKIEDAAKDTAKQTAEINEKTVGEIKTQAAFLDETANMLGRSIEGILGIGRDTTSQEMLEELKVANEQRAAQQNKPNEGMTNTGS